MTFEKREVAIPSWALMAVVSLFITVVGYTIGSAKVEAKTSTQVKYIQRDVDTKASKESVHNLESILLRVEGKLDRHIEQQINVE